MFNSSCTACPLHLKAISVCVPGGGPIPCDLLICGMNPGRLEDLRNQSFVGPAGAVLDACLLEAGLRREDVYATNVVKCASGNVKPTRTELATCSDLYLRQEIAAVKPRVIVALGDLALLALANVSGVNKHRGQQFRLRPGLQDVVNSLTNVVIVATFHPAAYLHAGRDPRITQAIVADLRAAREMLEGHQPQRLEVREGEPTGEVLGLDVETDAHGSLVVGTLADGGGTFRPFTASTLLLDGTYVAWNAKYEMRVLAAAGASLDRATIHDAMLLKHLLTSGAKGRFSLEASVLDEMGPIDPEWLESKHLVHSGQDVPLDRLTRYCAQDATLAVRLYDRFMPQVQAIPKLAALYEHIVLPACRLLARVEQQAIPLDAEYIRAADQDLTERVAALETEMAEIVGMEKVPNFRSHKVLVDVLYKRLGLKVTRVTDHGAPSTAKPVLMALKGLSPFVDRLLDLKRMNKLQSSYTRRWLKRLETGPYFADYRQHGTDTGRLSGDFQQVPRVVPGEVNLRDAVVAPAGMTLLESDYDQIELRLIAWRAQEETLLRLYREGADVHTYTGRMLFALREHEPIPSVVRQAGKTTNFGLSFGAGANKLAEVLLLNMSTEAIQHALNLLQVTTLSHAAARLYSRWHETFPGIRRWQSEERARIVEQGRAVAPHGRIKHLPFLFSRDLEERGGAFREGGNHVIQSTASDLCLLAAIMAERRMYDDFGAVAGPWLFHDSLLWLLRGPAGPAGAYLRSVMEEKAVRAFEGHFGLEIDLPITVSLKAGTRWGSLTPLTV